MKERPILFSGPMVRALIAGTKTQTRRLAKFLPYHEGLNLQASSLVLGNYCTGSPKSGWVLRSKQGSCWTDRTKPLHCPYGMPGDRLWVKETFSDHGAFGDTGRKAYRADIPDGKEPHGLHWKPSIFCTRAASRITLEVTAVRVERLNSISEADAIAEGVDINGAVGYVPASESMGPARYQYANLWSDINGAGSWDANPWVWVVGFRRVSA